MAPTKLIWRGRGIKTYEIMKRGQGKLGKASELCGERCGPGAGFHSAAARWAARAAQAHFQLVVSHVTSLQFSSANRVPMTRTKASAGLGSSSAATAATHRARAARAMLLRCRTLGLVLRWPVEKTGWPALPRHPHTWRIPGTSSPGDDWPVPELEAFTWGPTQRDARLERERKVMPNLLVPA